MIPFPTERRGHPIRFALRLLVAAYLVEAGLVLTIAPWTVFWERNYFAYLIPSIGAWMADPYVRGAVTGVGLVTTFAGLRDLSNVILARSTGGE
ncbi:MAG TPA: hypothetical protein VN700_09785 [Vicinamibacterales bacterium]|nr:hypothetical protein [Vicinamibacterales bacterium]